MPEWSPLLLFLGVPLFIGAVWLFIALVIGRMVWSGWKQRKENAASPVLTFPATVIGKRDSVGGTGTSTSTSYFVTFERLDLQRVELKVDGREFGLLAVGDTGRLTHQGTWYQGFVRNPPTAPKHV